MPREEDGEISKDDPEPVEPRIINIGGKATAMMGKGDRLIINTPGGGGWGEPEEDVQDILHEKIPWSTRGSLAERERVQAGF